MKTCVIPGTRPEAIKMSPVVRACEGSGADWFVSHAGQERLCDVGHDVLGGLVEAGYDWENLVKIMEDVLLVAAGKRGAL